jgi:hypothetical protein
VLQLPNVKVKELVALRGVGLQSAQLQLLESPDDHIETSGRRRIGVRALTSSPLVVTMKSRLPKHMCAPKVQSMSWLAIEA